MMDPRTTRGADEAEWGTRPAHQQQEQQHVLDPQKGTHDAPFEHGADSATDPVPLGGTPQTWRQLLHFTLDEKDPNGLLTEEEFVPQFEAHYGPCTIENILILTRRYAAIGVDLEPSDDQSELWGDLIFMLYMLGVWPDHPLAEQARAVLREFLASADRCRRLVSAISLGHLRDEQAIPALLALLTERFPDPQRGEIADEEEYSSPFWLLPLRQIPHLLWRWGVHQAVPALRQAVALTARIERAVERIERPGGEQYLWLQDWRKYQDHLLCALARFGAFGALVGIEPSPDERIIEPPANRFFDRYGAGIMIDREAFHTLQRNAHQRRLDAWRVTMCVEAVTQSFEKAGRHGRIEAAEVRREVERLLEKQFGLDDAERRATLEPYDDHQFWLELY